MGRRFRTVALGLGAGFLMVGGVGSAAAPAPASHPEDHFTISHLSARADGTTSFVVQLPSPGRLDVLETAWQDNLAKIAILQPAPRRFVFARARMPAASAGRVLVVVRPNARGLALVHHHRYRVTLRLWVSYTPNGGAARTDGIYGLHLTGAAQLTPRPDYVVRGHGVVEATSFVSYSRSNASFRKVRGTITLTGFINLHGVLTCLDVDHNQGTEGYRIVSGQNAGRGFVAAARAGTPSSGGAVLWYAFLPRAPTKCPSPTAPPNGAVRGASLSSGGITVQRIPVGRYRVKPALAFSR